MNDSADAVSVLFGLDRELPELVLRVLVVAAKPGCMRNLVDARYGRDLGHIGNRQRFDQGDLVNNDEATGCQCLADRAE